MNRPIEFRVWDHIQKRIAKVESIDWTNGDINYVCLCGGVHWLSTKNFEYLMQYTGLKDKLGNKIFEGDIVKFDNTCIGGASGVAEIFWLDDFCLQENPGWCMWNDGAYVRDSFLGSTVIGNIYQTPELLNE